MAEYSFGTAGADATATSNAVAVPTLMGCKFFRVSSRVVIVGVYEETQ